MEGWLAFAHMALYIAINHIDFIDKRWVEFDSVRRIFKMSQKHRIDSNQWAIHDKKVSTILIMFWAAICMGQRGPDHIWKEDTEKDRIKQ